ncbi:ABC transporter permease [Ferroacidibacillus organovorans]|uniref:Peptide ABC transporter n=1 Tax=Ferroacidibacillus organovorans TaxID=1765683 RepID=A0A162S8K3_9BACL|nr:ABC transporter permease [Ferroacidibacillus organovorans]KYP79614.1 peptide ABC transporter [Ferroacidibacillus organovorans]OAG92742.1 peptide ABC transporter [Ferroacidibacillus organovorans]OPG16364.1 peptide ABC transporter [Ferroacidibacillus organovorans]
MGSFLARRILLTLPVLFLVSVMVFSLIHLIPGDPARVILGQDATPGAIAALREQLGLNKPLIVQYLDWVGNVLHGNLGLSLSNQIAVATLIEQRLPVTIELAIGTFLFAVIIALPLGILSAIKRGKFADLVAAFATSLGLSIPPFWLGIMLLFAFTVRLHLFPSSGYVPLTQNVGQNLQSMFLPVLATGIREAAVLLRMTRASLAEVLDADFVRTARAKGIRGYRIILRHALKNALVPVITQSGLQIAGLLGGLVITETIFSLPGFGSLLVNAIFSRDYTTIQGSALVAALLVILVNLATDLCYGFIDPRIRMTRGEG